MLPKLHTDTALALGLKLLFAELEQSLQLSSPLVVYLAGGMAVHLYTSERVTTDVNAEFSARLAIPSDLLIDVELEGGESVVLYFDTNFSPMFGLVHEDYQQDAIGVDLGLHLINVRVLSPIDLAVSKLARFADNDREDIQTLVRLGLINASEIEERATSALTAFIDGQRMVRLNIDQAVADARAFEL